jgi:hypothetical protein
MTAVPPEALLADEAPSAAEAQADGRPDERSAGFTAAGASRAEHPAEFYAAGAGDVDGASSRAGRGLRAAADSMEVVD